MEYSNHNVDTTSCGNSNRTKRSMKRRRPWASPSTLVATTVLLTAHLWTQTAGIRVLLDEETMPDMEGRADPVELDVYSPTPAPWTQQPVTSPDAFYDPDIGIPLAVIKQSLDLSYDVELNVLKDVDINELLRGVKLAMEDYLFLQLQNLEDDHDIQIRKVTLAVSLVGRRQLQKHFPFLRQRILQGEQVQDIAIEVDGTVQYDLDGGGDTTPEVAEFLVEAELTKLLSEDLLRQAIESSDVVGILGVNEATVVGNRDDTGDNGNDNDENNNNQDRGNDEGAAGNSNTDTGTDAKFISTGRGRMVELERPSTLSIVFGFALTGIAFLGLVAYGYIFYRKRQKRLRRKRQMKESIQYRLPAPKVSPIKRSAPTTPQNYPQPPPPQLKMVPYNGDGGGDDSSDASSYKGIDSGSEEGPGDSFARELQMAASLDKQAWDDFQRKKDALDRNEVIKATEVGSAFGQYDSGESSQTPTITTTIPIEGGNSSKWAKSFPYGDEEVVEEGIEWPHDADDSKIWELGGKDRAKYSPRATKAEEKKDEWGNKEQSQDQVPMSTAAVLESIQRDLELHEKGEWGNTDRSQEPASMSTAAVLESIQRDLERHGTSIDTEPTEDMTASDVVLEVERLSRYVKRYEKRKERRAKREQERSSRSSDASSPRNMQVPSSKRGESAMSRSIQEDETASPSRGIEPNGRDMSHLNNNWRSGYSMSQKENYQHQEQAPRISTYMGTFDRNENIRTINPELASFSDYPDEISEDTFDYNFQGQSQDQDGSLRSQRLGITPFRAEEEEEPSFNYEAMPPIIQKLAKADTVASPRRDLSMSEDEPANYQRQRAQSGGEAYKNRGGPLSALRGNHAILDAKRPDRLSDLRDNSAIIDSSQSDINVSFQAPFDESIDIPLPEKSPGHPPKTPATTPKQPKKYTNGPSPSKKFNKLRNLFEERQNEAIFPPDQHWQYGVAR